MRTGISWRDLPSDYGSWHTIYTQFKRWSESGSNGGIQSACLSEGQRVDMKVFQKLWTLGEWSGIQYVIADKGYDYSAVRTPIKKAKKIPVIPRRANAIFPGLQDIYS